MSKDEQYKKASQERIIELIEEFCGSEADRKQQAFADMCGVSKFSISQYVNGSNAPGNITAAKIASKCRVDPLWVMGFDVPKRKKFKATFNAEDLHKSLEKYVDNSELDEAVENFLQETYYTNQEAAEIAQAIFDDNNLHALFDAARNSKPEDLKMAADLLKRLKGTGID